MNGGPGRIRTPDPLVRSQVLYPTELPVRAEKGGEYRNTVAMASTNLSKKSMSGRLF